jgi:hypothetical protein
MSQYHTYSFTGENVRIEFNHPIHRNDSIIEGIVESKERRDDDHPFRGRETEFKIRVTRYINREGIETECPDSHVYVYENYPNPVTMKGFGECTIRSNCRLSTIKKANA